MELRARVQQALGAPLAALPPHTFDTLEKLEVLLTKWERAVGLTGFHTTEERDRRYFAEALAALPRLPESGRVLDIGSGGGSPALPLAVARPALQWTLVESNARKCVFLDEAAHELGLENVNVLAKRYESLSPPIPYDVVTLRGVSVSHAMLVKIAEDLRSGGHLLWFSSASRLAEAYTGMLDVDTSGLQPTEAPSVLVPAGGSLLVAART